MKNSARGFTLVELLVVIAIIAILAAVVVLIINPLELMARSRDATRLADMENIQKIINISVQEGIKLCPTGSPTCSGNSNDTGGNARKINGTGWVKINFTGQTSVTVATLPVDPTNSSAFHYSYYSDSTNYELNSVLESNQEKNRMSGDGGNNNNVYEVGTLMTLIP